MDLRAFFSKFVRIKERVAARRTERPPAETPVAADFVALYQLAAIAPARYSAEQALALFTSLPPAPDEAKRQLLRQAVAAITANCGSSLDAVVDDAKRKAATLRDAIEREKKALENLERVGQAEIRAMELQLRNKADDMQTLYARERHTIDRYQDEMGKLDQVRQLLDPGAN